MELIKVRSYADLSKRAAEWALTHIRKKPESTIIPAMGTTPIGMYEEMSKLRSQGVLNTANLNVFQLDGYLDIAADNPLSSTACLKRYILEPWGIDEERVIILPEDGIEPEVYCTFYQQQFYESTGIDIAVLGLGENGQLGFNESPSDINAPTRVVQLSEESIQSKAAYWGGVEKVPRRAITAGMNIIFKARHILVLVSGEHKKDILQKTLHGEVSNTVPSSWLQKHPRVTIIADESAYL